MSNPDDCVGGLYIAYSVIEDVVGLIIGITAIIAIYQHIKHFRKKSNESPRSLYCVIITFYVLIVLFGLGKALQNECLGITPGILFGGITTISWWFQMIMIIAILFMRYVKRSHFFWFSYTKTVFLHFFL